MRDRLRGSLISATHLPHLRFLAPRYEAKEAAASPAASAWAELQLVDVDGLLMWCCMGLSF